MVVQQLVPGTKTGSLTLPLVHLHVALFQKKSPCGRFSILISLFSNYYF